MHAGPNTLTGCAYILWYFCKLSTHEELIKCEKELKQCQEFFCCTQKWRYDQGDCSSDASNQTCQVSTYPLIQINIETCEVQKNSQQIRRTCYMGYFIILLFWGLSSKWKNIRGISRNIPHRQWGNDAFFFFLEMFQQYLRGQKMFPPQSMIFSPELFNYE